jgi:hypothetical protein
LENPIVVNFRQESKLQFVTKENKETNTIKSKKSIIQEKTKYGRK